MQMVSNATVSAGQPSPVPADVPEDVTVCVTSCGRLDLLQQTLASFSKWNPGGRLLISEDTTDPDVIAKVAALYPHAEVLSGPDRLGIMGSIDRLYSRVTTPFIFHLEDDWAFDGPVDWLAAKKLLEERSDVANVLVRLFTEVRPKYRARSDALKFHGQEFRIMHRDAHPEFFGWSPNPGLIRLDLYERYRPFSRVMPDQMSGIIKKDGAVVAYMLPGVASHIGHGRNVTDPTMPPRPKSKIGKLLRAIRKKLYYAGLRKEPF